MSTKDQNNDLVKVKFILAKQGITPAKDLTSEDVTKAIKSIVHCKKESGNYLTISRQLIPTVKEILVGHFACEIDCEIAAT